MSGMERAARHLKDKNGSVRAFCWGWGPWVEAMAGDGVEMTVVIAEGDEYASACGNEPNGCRLEHRMEDAGYVSLPILEGVEYDLVVVAGLMALDCLAVARRVLAKDGVVLVDASLIKIAGQAARSFLWRREYDGFEVMSNDKEWPMEAFSDYNDVEHPNTTMENEETLLELRRRMTTGEPFTYLRFGDADLFFIEDSGFSMNRRHDPNPEMSRELAEAFRVDDPAYMVGTVVDAGVFRKKEPRLQRISQSFHSGRTYFSAVAFHTMYVADQEEFVDFVKACFWGRSVLFVGGESVARDPLVQKVFNVAETVELSDRNAYSMLDSKMKEIRSAATRNDVIVAALGQATRVLGWRLWHSGMRGIQFFDVGSTVDALAGRELRSWIRRHSQLVHRYREIFMS